MAFIKIMFSCHHLLRRYLLLALAVLASVGARAQKHYSLQSPSKSINVTIETGDSVYYSIALNGTEILSRSTAALITNRGKPGIKPQLISAKSREVRGGIINQVPFKRREIPDRFNETVFRFKNEYSITFRVYDDGVAYRFETSMNDTVLIQKEIAHFNYKNADTVFFARIQKRDNQDRYHTSFEEPYLVTTIDAVQPTEICFSPTLINSSLVKSFITESDLNDYPGMFLQGTSAKSLHGVMAAYPDREEVQGSEYKQWAVTSRKPYIAKTKGKRSFPWRVIGLAESDKDLLMNDLVYRLASAPVSTDWSWIKPGMCTDEWIIGSNLFNVGFKTGFNTATYKYYVDFAKQFGIPYVMLDAGWSDNDDLLKITPGLDLAEVVRYAKQNNVRIMLWTLAMTLDRQLGEAMRMFTTLGIAGINVDFMDRDDQKTVNFYHRIADAAANHKLMVMFHGAFKNAGFERTHPNAITREGILGSEYNMWSEKATPDHDAMIPFIRMLSGPLDYEPGFLVNANKKTFRALPELVMSQGTRTHQLAMFVVYESPLQVFAGNPSQAMLEPEYTKFMASIPSTWDDTVPLAGKIGDYVAVARRSGTIWYVGALNDWTARNVEVDLNFLGDKPYRIEICSDGINADKAAVDYTLQSQNKKVIDKLIIHLAAGGGYVARFIPADQ
ncbi:glycoside hydrolase family 97 protein [Chryseolinea sp. T2]|uniref:glycoside hydrolase family 97 protein n=1 Tax=Chryseolinea sp. T2 TaxID=3129255 RepID=UPI0030784F6F